MNKLMINQPSVNADRKSDEVKILISVDICYMFIYRDKEWTQ